jgi:hypothetical protein
MTDAWQLRRCSTCGVLETDLAAHLVFDQGSDEIVHLRGGGLYRCGVLVPVDANEVVP